MKTKSQNIAMVTLRLVLGIAVVVQSLFFLYGEESAAFFARHGLPNGLRLALGWTEIAAAVLFLLPPTLVVGSWSLLVVFAGALAIHIVHGQYQVGGLLVYAAAVLAVLAHAHERTEAPQLPK